MVPADSRRIPRVPRYSGYRYTASDFAQGAVTRCGRTFQNVTLVLCVRYRGPTTPKAHYYASGLGSSPVARHYWGNHVCFLFLEVLRCFSSLGWRHRPVPTAAVLQTAGLSHSEIPGSEVICTYPGLIAAYHVLHRLHEPRHPPCALYYFRFPAKRPDAHTFSSSSHLHRTCGKEFPVITVLLVSICQRSLSQI